MWNKGVASVLLPVLLVACGGGGEKEAFANYEKAVEPLLSEEAALRDRLDERMQDAVHYGGESDITSMVEEQLAPFYDEMATKVADVPVEGEKLAEIHDYLVRYVGLRQELLAGFLSLNEREEAVREAAAPATRKIDAARAEAKKATEKVNETARSNPTAVPPALGSLFSQEGQVFAELDERIGSLTRGEIPPAAWRQFVERRYRPFYAQVGKALDQIDVGDDGAPVVLASKAYVAAVGKMLDASFEVADVREEAGQETGPAGEKLRDLQARSTQMLTTYKEEAKRYRDSLK